MAFAGLLNIKNFKSFVDTAKPKGQKTTYVLHLLANNRDIKKIITLLSRNLPGITKFRRIIVDIDHSLQELAGSNCGDVKWVAT